MTAKTTNLMLRNDTILGVCEAIGQDFGFNPNWLRVAFCIPMFWNPALVMGTYLGLGILVAAIRFAFPDKRADIGKAAPAATHLVEAKAMDVTGDREPELIAA
ncbi:PspC domain-containing protein [Sphingomonas alba]|uniref:PspC domain-containing protein n=1 Tax=Sphingomonas alba TaxID=2908208 RepID=A0ABT0RIQ2_9SPHN|nr:PspC domain-containing protein [Sphingomonas alba]MCL6682475.1 PspC domain-containing protein [Sphingomonas alba]